MSKVIYETSGRAREYRELACNLVRGCDHGCIYCYAPNATRRNRGAFGVVEARPNMLRDLAKDADELASHREERQIMLCFTCDAYSPGAMDLKITRQALQILKSRGLNVSILTKGGHRSVADLDLLSTEDSYAATLTCFDDATSQLWEPRAALPQERMEALSYAHERGIHTWVSLEPVLDPDTSLSLIEATQQYVDEYKLGKLNYHPLAGRIDWQRYAADATWLLQKLGKAYYVKHDLRRYLPSTAA